MNERGTLEKMDTIKHKSYAAEEFADDKNFWRWVLKEDENQNNYWETFIRENPDKAKEIERAKDIVLQLNTEKHRLDQNKVEALWEKIKLSKEAYDAAVIPATQERTVKSSGAK